MVLIGEPRWPGDLGGDHTFPAREAQWDALRAGLKRPHRGRRRALRMLFGLSVVLGAAVLVGVLVAHLG